MINHRSTKELRSRGFRITVARSAILNILTNETKPLCASEIHRIMLFKKLKSDRVTVYRELNFLQKQGVIQVVQFQDRKRRFEVTTLKHHHHLICQKCKSIKDVNLKNDLKSKERSIEKRTNFKILSHSLEFFGLCPNCR